jgi:hypothetical protein
MSNNDSEDPSVGGAIVGSLSGAVAGVHISAAVTAATGGLGVVLAPLIIGASTGYGVWRGAMHRKSPISPGLSTAGDATSLFDRRG